VIEDPFIGQIVWVDSALVRPETSGTANANSSAPALHFSVLSVRRLLEGTDCRD
jgi:hypothetical protein